MKTLSRKQIYIAGLIIIFIFFLINRITFIYNASHSYGLVVPASEMTDFAIYDYGSAVIKFTKDSMDYYFTGMQFVHYDMGEIVNVIFLDNDPENAYVFSFIGFWYAGLLWCLLPIMFYSAFIYSYIKKNQYIEVNIKYPFIKKRKKNLMGSIEKFTNTIK